jgi:hypothetical protein
MASPSRADLIKVCRKHGLGLNDLVALQVLSDDLEQAESLASQFSKSDAETSGELSREDAGKLADSLEKGGW